MAPLKGAYRKKIAKKSARHKEVEVKVIWRSWTVKEHAVKGQKQKVKKEGGSKREKNERKLALEMKILKIVPFLKI